MVSEKKQIYPHSPIEKKNFVHLSNPISSFTQMIWGVYFFQSLTYAFTASWFHLDVWQKKFLLDQVISVDDHSSKKEKQQPSHSDVPRMKEKRQEHVEEFYLFLSSDSDGSSGLKGSCSSLNGERIERSMA